MTDVALTLQDAIVAALRNDADVTALVGQRIYDRVPPMVEKPYITIGPADVTSNDADCVNGNDVTQQIDVWSVEPGFAQCKDVGGAVRKCLDKITVTQDGLTFEIENRAVRYFMDADGLTAHGVITVQALIDTP
jgi:hypothetical protein